MPIFDPTQLPTQLPPLRSEREIILYEIEDLYIEIRKHEGDAGFVPYVAGCEAQILRLEQQIDKLNKERN